MGTVYNRSDPTELIQNKSLQRQQRNGAWQLLNISLALEINVFFTSTQFPNKNDFSFQMFLLKYLNISKHRNDVPVRLKVMKLKAILRKQDKVSHFM